MCLCIAQFSAYNMAWSNNSQNWVLYMPFSICHPQLEYYYKLNILCKGKKLFVISKTLKIEWWCSNETELENLHWWFSKAQFFPFFGGVCWWIEAINCDNSSESQLCNLAVWSGQVIQPPGLNFLTCGILVFMSQGFYENHQWVMQRAWNMVDPHRFFLSSLLIF